jgi:hypothetical protein
LSASDVRIGFESPSPRWSSSARLCSWARTAVAGGLVLSLLLAWVAGFHFAVGWGSRMLLLFLAAVLALTAGTRAFSPRTV